MTSAYVLIAAVLLLGGTIAALGDFLGSKVGKARLRLFCLRPRQSATVVTVLTGITIAASTLGILFSLSKSLREGIFSLDEILEKRRELKIELDLVTQEKNSVKKDLASARVQQAEVRDRLEQTNRNFQQARERLQTVSKQIDNLRSEIESLQTERKELSAQKKRLIDQIAKLQKELQERDRQLAEREQKIVVQDKILKDKERVLQQKEKVLQALEKQREILQKTLAYEKKEADKFIQSYQELRSKKIAVVREQVLAIAAVRLSDPKAATAAIDRLLWQANQAAFRATNPTAEGEVDRQAISIYKTHVKQLIEQIDDGRNYVVRVLSAGNYVQGEGNVQVLFDVIPNQKIFAAGETLATVSFSVQSISQEDFKERLDWLLSASQFRARRAGIMGEIQLEDGSVTSLINFLKEPDLMEEPPEEIRVIASDTTYTIGPLKLRLVAVRKGEIIFRT